MENFSNMEPPPGAIPFNPLHGVPPAAPDSVASVAPGGTILSRQGFPSLPAAATEPAETLDPSHGQAVLPAQGVRFMTAADMFAAPARAESPPVDKEFTFGGQVFALRFSTAARTDAQAKVELLSLLQTLRPALNVKTPEGKVLRLTSRLYLGELHLLAATVLIPQLSIDEWAIFGCKYGANGEQKGWHGIQDVADFAVLANGLTPDNAAEDEKRAGEGSSSGISTTDSSAPPSE